ncbi:MAG: hypothetical protein QOJ56_2583 [Mycobacterium sp.]|nr:hypothetical protein [Mycobacterium sp.]
MPSGSSGASWSGHPGESHRECGPRRAAVHPTHCRPDRCGRCASHRPVGRRARHRARCSGWGFRQGLLLGGRCRCSHRSWGVRAEFPSATRSDGGHRLQLRDRMGFPRHRRHHSCRLHRDAGCAGGQASTPDPRCRYVGECKRGPEAKVTADGVDSECKSAAKNVFRVE